MKWANTWAGFLLFGVWLTSSAVADPGHAFHGGAFVGRSFRGAAAFRNTALVRDATLSRPAAAFRRTALIRDATLSRQAAAFRRTALVRDATASAWRGVSWHRGTGWRFGPYGARYGYGHYRDRFDRRYDGYPDGAGWYGGPGFYDYADPYGYGYVGDYPYPANYPYDDSYGSSPEYDNQAADSTPPVTTGVGLVTAVQTKLTRQAYYDGPVDGAINDQTRRAIREYQKDHGLSVDGLINPELLSSMAIHYVSPLS